MQSVLWVESHPGLFFLGKWVTMGVVVFLALLCFDLVMTDDRCTAVVAIATWFVCLCVWDSSTVGKRGYRCY